MPRVPRPLLPLLLLLLLLTAATQPGMALAQAQAQPRAPLPSPSPDLRNLLSTPDHFVMIRHATAPGFSDPPGMRLDDCGTQRNLSDEGRQEAARVGAALRAAGLARARVYSSQWCRCLDTARQLALGDPTPLPVLNSFFDDPTLAQPQSRALRDWLAAADLSKPVVLVTHQVNMTALTGQSPQTGELFVVRRQAGELTLVARFTEAALRASQATTTGKTGPPGQTGQSGQTGQTGQTGRPARPVPDNYGLPR